MKYFILLNLLFSTQVYSAVMNIDQSCQKLKETMPVLAGGRVKPLYVLGQDTIKALTGKSKPKSGETSLNTICSIYQNTVKNIDFEFPILVEHSETKKLLGVNEASKSVDYKILLENDLLIRSEIA